MKKILQTILIIAVCTGIVTGCTEGTLSPPADVKVAALKGPSSIGMVKLMDDADNGTIQTNNFSFDIFASADEVVPKIVQRQIDIAALPANLASVLFNNTKGNVQVIAVGTLGMLYVVESGKTVTSIEDLRGKTVYAGFKGKSPEYDFNYILKSNGIDPVKDINIEWKSEHTESVAALAANNNAIAVLPQPFATTAQLSNKNIRAALDLNKEWEKIQEKHANPSSLVTGVVVARTEFIKQNPEALNDFLDRYMQSAEFAINKVEETASLVEKYNIFPAAVAKKAIPYCNITFIKGQEMKKKLSGYLNILFKQNPQSVGGKLPNDDFYFIR